jgi:sulfur relay (sulfurtransferase) complex TusBCD TusD component (DsrE family)
VVSLRGKKLGVLLSIAPDQPGFDHGIRLAETGLDQGVEVYLYCLDDAVAGLTNDRLQALRARGLKLFACALAARRRNLALDGRAVFSGLSTLGDILAGADRFVSFN